MCTDEANAECNQNQRTEIFTIRTKCMPEIRTQSTIKVGIVTANVMLDSNVRIEHVTQVTQLDEITRTQLSGVTKNEGKCYSSNTNADEILDTNAIIEHVAHVEKVEDITRVQLCDVTKTERTKSSTKIQSFKLASQSGHSIDKQIKCPMLLSYATLLNGGHVNEVCDVDIVTAF